MRKSDIIYCIKRIIGELEAEIEDIKSGATTESGEIAGHLEEIAGELSSLAMEVAEE